ncbi:MAG: hypothetical protein RMM08_00590 [Armatimonadota bacterium]|nr:hypothetical protein [bacterium]MDW8319832.1 hypothetical protein [Armatimonadota bacterium]
MRKGALCLLTGVIWFAWLMAPVSADALLRAWAESGNEFPVRLSIQGLRGRYPAGTTQTVRFTLQNPLPPQTIQLQASATYTTRDGRQVTTYSNAVTLEIDQAARDCHLYFYVINGFVVEDSLFISGRRLHLPERSSFVVIPIDELPAGTVLRGQVSIFAY